MHDDEFFEQCFKDEKGAVEHAKYAVIVEVATRISMGKTVDFPYVVGQKWPPKSVDSENNNQPTQTDGESPRRSTLKSQRIYYEENFELVQTDTGSARRVDLSPDRAESQLRKLRTALSGLDEELASAIRDQLDEGVRIHKSQGLAVGVNTFNPYDIVRAIDVVMHSAKGHRGRPPAPLQQATDILLLYRKLNGLPINSYYDAHVVNPQNTNALSCVEWFVEKLKEIVPGELNDPHQIAINQIESWLKRNGESRQSE